MARVRRGWARQFLGLSVGGLLIASIGLAVLLFWFPWATSSSRESEGHFDRFLTYWPKPILLDVREEKKRLKRFAASEQRRRLALQLRRMEFLNVTLSELDRDPAAQVVSETSVDRSYRSYEWPFSPDDPAASRSELVYLPVDGGFVVRRGLRLRAGDELKFSADLSRDPRNLIFYAYPLAPGSLRGTLGKYSFNSNFEAAEVQKTKRISISIGDATATQFRVRCLVGEFYLLFPRITRFEHSGRIPVQLAEDASEWSLPAVELDTPKPKSDEEPSGGPSASSGTQQQKLVDPEDIESNPVKIGGEATVALGYNVVLIRRPLREVSKPATRYQELKRFVTAAREFAAIETTEKDLGDVMIQGLSASLGRFGYHTVGFAVPSFFGVPQREAVKGLSGGGAPPWMSLDDVSLEQKNQDLERSERPAKGLEAIFDRRSADEFRGLSPESWRELSVHQARSHDLEETPSLRNFSEAYVLDPGVRYLADLVGSYQSWSEDQWQNRFFHAVDLSMVTDSDVSLQNLVAGLSQNVSGVLRIPAWPRIAKGDSLDRSVDQILESLRARKLLHRTVIVVLETASLGDEKVKVKTSMMIPGLHGKKLSQEGKNPTPESEGSVALRKVTDEIRSAVGALEERTQESREESPPAQGDSRPSGEALPKMRVRLTFLPLAEDCRRVRWQSPEPLSDLKWENIKMEGAPEFGLVDVFPCSGAGHSWLSWRQSASHVMKSEPGFVFGGQFVEEMTSGEEHEFALFYGPKLLSATEFRLSQMFGLEQGKLLSQTHFLSDPHEDLRRRINGLSQEQKSKLKFVGLIESVPAGDTVE